MRRRCCGKSVGFTLFEVVLALAILALLTGAVYMLSGSAIDASRETLAGRVTSERIEAFVHVTRNAFLNLPSQGQLELRYSRSLTGAPVAEVIFYEASGLFGIPSIGSGALILAARPMSDGTRTISLLLAPKETLDSSSAKGTWIPLLPHVEMVKWAFLSNGEWNEEWKREAGRPMAARLQLECRDIPGGMFDVQFWIPPLINPNPSLPAQPPLQP